MSAVKRANLSAEQTAKNNPILQPKDFKSDKDQKYINKLGATPNEIKSLKESNSAPKLLPPFNFLANHPSKKSKIAANIIKKIAICHSWSIENLIDDKPQQSDNIVIVLGKYLLKKFELLFILYFFCFIYF